MRVLSYDVALYLKYFIREKKWFTLMNQQFTQFKYKASDALTKPKRGPSFLAQSAKS